MKVFRGMLPDEDNLPKAGDTGRTLGARPAWAEDDIDPEDRIEPGDRIEADIPVSAEGIVQPFTGGMSVAQLPLSNLRPHRRPPRHGGRGKKIEVYELETDELPDGLRCRIDPYGSTVHALIEPTWEMTFEEYQQALHATRALWRLVR